MNVPGSIENLDQSGLLFGDLFPMFDRISQVKIPGAEDEVFVLGQ